MNLGSTVWMCCGSESEGRERGPGTDPTWKRRTRRTAANASEAAEAAEAAAKKFCNSLWERERGPKRKGKEEDAGWWMVASSLWRDALCPIASLVVALALLATHTVPLAAPK